MARTLSVLALSLVLVSASASPAFSEWGDDAVKKGNELVRAGNIDGALEVYRKGAEANPKNAKLHLVYGLTLARKGQAVEAARQLRASVKLEPTFQGWYSLGLVYAGQNAFSQAIEAYQEALKINPRAYKAWYQLGLVRSAQAQFDSALEAYGKSVEMNPQFEEGYLGLGSAYYWSGDRDAARRQVDKMKLLKMTDKAEALDSWLKKKEAAPSAPPSPVPAAELDTQAGEAA